MRKLLSLPIDYLALFIPVLLCALGIVTIYTITFTQHQSSLAISQTIFVAIGLVAMFSLMFTDYRFLGTISLIFYLLAILLLIPLLPQLAPHIPIAIKVFGAYRWINLGFFQLQSAEVSKLLMAIAGARFLSGHIGRLASKQIIGYLLLSIVPFGLVVAQPDLGTAGALFIILISMFLAARPSLRLVGLLAVVLAIIVPLVFFHLKPYQVKRVETFLNPSSDPQGQGYNIRQALIAVGSGGITGRGFGQGSQTVLNFLPVAHADFIFAGFAEATGFVGSVILISLYVLLIYRCITIARESADQFGQLLAIGIAAKFLFQMAVHIGMNMALLPATGIPLPFMSYGGTAIIIDLAAMGILESIYIRHKKFVFS